MGAYESAGNLAKAVRELLSRWHDVRMQWDDPVSRAFEQKYLEPMQNDARVAMTAMSEMATLLDRIRRDCS